MFKKGWTDRKKYYVVHPAGNKVFDREKSTAGGEACPSCGARVDQEVLSQNCRVCPECGYHYLLSAPERIELLVDEGSWEEFDKELISFNILCFPDYDLKLKEAREKSGLNEAVITGKASIGGYKVILGVMDSRFAMGSMGSVVGEKILRAGERALKERLPLVLCTASGGARIQEGMFSLMQMARTSAVIERLHKAGLLYISIMTHPTTGGVAASFAALADIIIAEPKALIGFTGPRVIKQTIRQELPEGFQQAEFLLEHGMIDMVVKRNEIRDLLIKLLKLHQGGKYEQKVSV
ncbi:acetyl-CoA carboxylase carboxyl transferase subunit beta [Thermosyntropha lipolytica DSM 11003]|uniref:Acetyl-coenzyme A carboxylase carboxyl transferase subunit beta n=1 Tax=Thermosyntropha lipolytica DSM 11003 TaxID=1123382 RepID=A0A1M5JCW6_9FIRM|nr:acetyl-CoA carboxylase, carboxyltransferase subunit beta [Thermosyntropha lipolytica]SHG38424.1 acetyl-CoA carboxylase carboxyl transferase subunit beta [Thermosyntropha lipolytica DSM 11003]